MTDAELHDFISTLKSQVEIFINRMKSNSSRGRSIANDSSVQTLFLNITAMHSQLLRYIQQHDDSRLYYERLQDKLTQVKDARAALDALRDEHREKLRRQAEDAERQRQLQMAHKLDIMRKKKQEYLQYQRQLALQRVQEQEREMQMRQEQQKQQYLMGSGYGTYKGSPVHNQFPPNSAPPAAYRTYPYGQPIMMQGPPHTAPQGMRIPHPGMPGMPQQLPPPGLQQPMQPPGLGQVPTPGIPHQLPPQPGPPPQVGMPQPQSNLSIQQVIPQSVASQVSLGQVQQQGITQQFQQPGAPPASPQVPQGQQNGDAQTAELISFD